MDNKNDTSSSVAYIKNSNEDVGHRVGGTMSNKRMTLVIICVVIATLLINGLSIYFGVSVYKKSKAHNEKLVQLISYSEGVVDTIPKYEFLTPVLSDYICKLCNSLEYDSDLAVSHLMAENPLFDASATHTNPNGTVDCGLFQLNDRYVWTYFKDRYWVEEMELNPFNWKHNTFIAINHLAYLNKKYADEPDKAIMAYNCGEGAVDADKIPADTYVYLAKVKNNYTLLVGKTESE